MKTVGPFAHPETRGTSLLQTAEGGQQHWNQAIIINYFWSKYFGWKTENKAQGWKKSVEVGVKGPRLPQVCLVACRRVDHVSHRLEYFLHFIKTPLTWFSSSENCLTIRRSLLSNIFSTPRCFRGGGSFLLSNRWLSFKSTSKLPEIWL